jgi:hypothetical protein
VSIVDTVNAVVNAIACPFVQAEQAVAGRTRQQHEQRPHPTIVNRWATLENG